MTIYDFENIKKTININEYNEMLKNSWTRNDNRIWYYEIYNFINNQWICDKYNVLHRAQGKYLINDSVKINKYLYIYALPNYYLQFIDDINCYIFNLKKYGEIGCKKYINDYNRFDLEKINKKLINNNIQLNKEFLINIINYINSRIILRKV